MKKISSYFCRLNEQWRLLLDLKTCLIRVTYAIGVRMPKDVTEEGLVESM